MFGQQNTSPFASPPATSTPFGAPPATSTFGTPAAPAAPFGSTGFGSAPATGGFGQAPATGFGTTSTFGAPAPAAPGGFGATTSTGFGTTTGGAFGAQAPSTSPFAPAPASGGLFGSTPAAAPSTGLFGSSGGTAFGSTAATQPTGGFGSTTTSGFGGTTTTSAFGGTTTAFGQPAAAAPTSIFGSTAAPASGGLFGSSAAPAAPLFGGGGSPAPAPGLFGSPSAAAGVGTRVAPFQPTTKSDGTSSITFQCLTAMPQYENKSFEELRCEDYAQGNRGDGSQAQQQTAGFGSTFASTTPAPSTGFGGFGAPAAPAFGGSPTAAPAPFGVPAPAPAFGGFGGTAQAAAPFGTTAAAAPAAFGSTFGTAARPPGTSLFGGSPTPAPAPAGGSIFGGAAAPAAPTGSLFGTTPAPAPTGLFGASPAPAFGTTQPPAPGLFGGQPAAAPAAPASLFGQPAAPAGGSIFGGAAAPAAPTGSLFGTTPAPAPTGLFGASPAPAFGTTQPPAPGLFGGQPAAAPAAPASLFGQPAQPTTSLFGAQPVAAPAAPVIAPTATIVQPTAMAVLEQQLAAVQNQTRELEQMEVWRGRSPPGSSVRPTSQSETQALRVSPYSASPVSALPYRASPKASVKIRPRGFDSSKPAFSLQKSNVPIMSPGTFIASATKRLVIKPETPKPTLRLRFKEVAVEETKDEEPLLHLPAVSPPAAQPPAVTSPPAAAAPPVASPPATAATTPAAAETTPPESSSKTPEMTPTNGHGYDFYKKVIANAGSARANKQSDTPAESLVPSLSMTDYAIAPSRDELAAMSEADLATVSGFTVTRAGVGSITWDGSVDVRGVNLDEVVSIKDKDVAVYDAAEADGTKPPVGTKLNRSAVITMQNVFPKEGANAEAVEKFERKVAKSTTNMNAELISYDSSSGVWKFRVPHFSRYALLDDTDEEDDAMEVEQVKPSEPNFESGERGGRSPLKESVVEGEASIDVGETWFTAFVNENEVDVPLVSDVEMGGTEKNVVREAEQAYKAISRTIESDRKRQEEQKSILKKKKEEEEAKMLFPDEGVVVEDISPCRFVPDKGDLVLSSRPSACARIAKKCGVESFSSSSTDYGMRMGRSFRVGWKPDGSFFRLRSDSAVIVQQDRPVITVEADAEEQASRLIATHLKHSKPIACPSRKCPAFCLASGQGPSSESNVRKALSDYVVASDRQGRTISSDPEAVLVLMRAFSLLLCLFSHETSSPTDSTDVPMIEGPDGSRTQIALKNQDRIDACLKWLSAACAEDVRTVVNAALQRNDVPSAIFAALTGGDVEQASVIAMKHQYLHLASVMAAGSVGFDSVRDQVQRWTESGASSKILTELLRIYTLLGGDLSIEEQLSLSCINEGKLYPLDWRRRLCMLLAFGVHPADDATLESLIEKYDVHVAENVAPHPSPRYSPSVVSVNNESPKSLLYKILELARTMEDENSSVTLASVVAPPGYTTSTNDVSGAFHVAAAISAVTATRGPRLSPTEQARLLDSYAAELVNMGRWDLAVYVMLCCFGYDRPEDLLARERVAKSLVVHNCSAMSDPGMISKRSQLEKIAVPSAWFDEALAYSCGQRGDAFEYVKHLAGFSADEARRAVEQLIVPNTLFMNGPDLRQSLKVIELFSWDEDTLAATVLDFFQLSEDILALSASPNSAKGSDDGVSLSATARSVKERFLAFSANTTDETSAGLQVVPRYRLVPRSVFLSEAIAGVSFLQLQLKALEAGRSIWVEDLRGIRRPFKVASELAFLGVKSEVVSSHESASQVEDETLRGLI